jgi:hypothetical protein
MIMIKLVKLTTGEEVVATVENLDPEYCRLTDCAQFAMVAANQMGMGPFLPHCNLKDGITVAHSNIIFMVDLNEQFRQEYQKIYSKVITPSSLVL